MAREITCNSFEISLVVFMTNITTNNAITYTSKTLPTKIYFATIIHCWFLFIYSFFRPCGIIGSHPRAILAVSKAAVEFISLLCFCSMKLCLGVCNGATLRWCDDLWRLASTWLSHISFDGLQKKGGGANSLRFFSHTRNVFAAIF